MTDDLRFQSLMKLSDFRFERWKERRSHEWKISIGLWGLLAAAVIYIKPSNVLSLLLLALLLALCVLLHAWFWVRPNWISSEMDIRTAFYFAEHAEKIVLDDSPMPGKRLHPNQFRKENGGWQFLGTGVCQFEVLVTVLLAVGIWMLLASNHLH